MKFDKLVSLAVLGAVLAVQSACDCPDPYEVSVPLMPPVGALDEDFYALACLRECPQSLECEPDPVLVDGGETVPVLRCTIVPECIGGRRARSNTRLARPARSAASRQARDWLVQAARLEADSVAAFRQLREDLRQLGAPRALVRACGRSAREEQRHARSVGALARRYGARSCAASPLAPAPAASLLELARHNASEGCVRESFGAVLALWQSVASTDPQVRAVMARVAREEARHAALSWKIDAWARSRLFPAERLLVDQARTQAVRELLSSPWAPGAPELGLPAPAEARALAQSLFAQLGLPT